MAKKFGKFIMTTAALGALAAGAYYFFMKKDEFLDDDFDDDDFDDFDEDLDDDVADRRYVDLDLTKTAENVEAAVEEKADDFKEGLNAAKAEATDKIVGESKEADDAANKAEEEVEEYFDDEDEDFEDDTYNSLDSI